MRSKGDNRAPVAIAMTPENHSYRYFRRRICLDCFRIAECVRRERLYATCENSGGFGLTWEIIPIFLIFLCNPE